MIAIGIGSAPNYARIVRASVLTVKEQEFVESARCVGAGDLYIIIREILPNALSPIIVQATLGVASAILSAAALSFIGWASAALSGVGRHALCWPGIYP